MLTPRSSSPRRCEPEAPLLKVDGLAKTFIDHARGSRTSVLAPLSFELRVGQAIVMSAPSGAGKSTLLNCLHRTCRASAGRALYRTADGPVIDLVTADDLTIAALRTCEIALATQFLRCPPRRTAHAVVAAAALRAGVKAGDAEHAARLMLTELGLAREAHDRAPAGLSGGERQRVNVARAFAGPRRLVLLDEPTASLDARSAERVIALIAAQKQNGVSMVVATHDPQLRAQIANQVITLPKQAQPNALMDAER